MKNNLCDLNNLLFVQLEKLMDDDICKDLESTQMEIRKTEAVTKVADQIIEIANTQVRALELTMEYNIKREEMPCLIENKRG